MSTRTAIDARELADALLKVLTLFPIWWADGRETPSRHRIEGAYICASYLARLDPGDSLLAARQQPRITNEGNK